MSSTVKCAGDSELKDTVWAFPRVVRAPAREGMVSGPLLWMLALEGESPAFPMEHNPSPLNLLALERTQLIFLSGVDKGCCCPRLKGLW